MLTKEQKEKWLKILWVVPLFVLYSFGDALSGIVGRIFFVEHIGAEYLPRTYVAGAILGALMTIFIAHVMKKMSLATILQWFSWIGALFCMGTYILMDSGGSWVYSTFLIVSYAFYLILGGTVIWRIAGNLSTLFEFKAMIFYYSLAYGMGGVLAGFASSYLTEPLGLKQLILLLGGSLVAAAINLIMIERYYSEKLEPIQEENTTDSELEALRKEFADFKKTRLAKMLFVVLIIFNIVWWTSDFEFQKIAGNALSEEAYSKLLGLLSIVSGIMLVIALAIQNKIIKKVGALNAFLMSPIIVFGAFLTLFLFPIPLFAFIASVITPLVGNSIFKNATMSTYTALPTSIGNRVATFIGGNSDSIAMLLAGAGLMTLTEFLDNRWVLATTCILLLINALILSAMKKVYLKQVVLNLGSTNRLDMHGALENLAEKTYNEVGIHEIMKLMSWRNLDNETLRKVIFTLGKIGNVKVIPNLLEMLGKHDASLKYSIVETIHSFPNLNEKLKELPFTQLNIIEAYERIFLQEEDAELKVLILENLGNFGHDKVISFLCDAIKNQNVEVSTKAIMAMRYFHDRGVVTYVKPYLENSNPMTQTAAIISLWQFSELKPLLMKYCIQIMAKNSEENVLAALSLIGTLEFTWEKSYAQKYASNANKNIQKNALLTLLQLGDAEPIPSIVAALTLENSNSIFFARALKKIPTDLKKIILKKIKNAGEIAIKNCIQILDATYLNFTEEIEILSGR